MKHRPGAKCDHTSVPDMIAIDKLKLAQNQGPADVHLVAKQRIFLQGQFLVVAKRLDYAQRGS